MSLSWNVDDPDDEATVDLYYDTDLQGQDGVLIAEDLPESQESYNWDTSGLPTGQYYVYAVASDGKNAPVVEYSPERLQLIASNAPSRPDGVSASAQDTAFTVSWSAVDRADRYTVYYAEGEDPGFHSRSAPVGDTTAVLLERITPGRTYHLAVSASDSTGAESLLSEVTTITYESSSENNAPVVTTTDPKVVARTNETYQAQITATDRDGDPLRYELSRGPEGMQVGPEGEITWEPDAGVFGVEVRVSDGNGGADSLAYSLQVLDPQSATAELRFVQSTYVGTDAVGQIVLADPDLNQSPSEIESRKLSIRTGAAPGGTDLQLRETAANSGRFQAGFGFSEASGQNPVLDVRPRDTLSVRYEDSYPDTTVAATATFREDLRPLSVTSLRPESGVVGTAVRIYGTGFDPTASGNTVRFGSEIAEIDSAKNSVLYTQVPVAANGGSLEVSVQSDNEMATLSERFTVLTESTDRKFIDVGAGLIRGNSTTIADVNGDGALDLLITGTDAKGDPTTKLYLQKETGIFADVEAGLTDVYDGSTSIADVNGDGTLDLLIIGRDVRYGSSSITKLYLQQEDGSFSEAEASLSGVHGSSTSIADVNGDGALDLLITGEDNDSKTKLYLQQRDGSFSEAEAGLSGVSRGSTSIADVNGDGALDLLVTGKDKDNDPTTKLYLQQEDGGFSEAEVGLTDVDGSTSIADINGDGALDLLITGEDNDPKTTLYLQQEDGGFSEAEAGLTDVDGPTSIADVNGDGALDLLITGWNANYVRTTKLYLQQEDGGFSEAEAGLTGVGDDGSTSIADVNGDGILDLLIAAGSSGGDPTTTLYSSGPDITPPRAPVNLTRSVGDGKVSFSWKPNGETDFAGYNLYRSGSTIDDTTSATLVNDTLITDTGYIDSDVSNGTTYYYRLTAVEVRPKGWTGDPTKNEVGTQDT